MVKKVSLKDSASLELVNKERFITGLKPLSEEEVKNTNILINKQTNKSGGTHKAMIYIPQSLWIKINNHRLEQIKQGKKLESLNRTVINFLEKRFEKY